MRKVKHNRTLFAALRDDTSGFTLIEITVVLLIVAILYSVAIPTMTGVMNSTEKKVCENNRQMLMRYYTYYKMLAPDVDLQSFLDGKISEADDVDKLQCPSGGKFYVKSPIYDATGKIVVDGTIACTVHDGEPTGTDTKPGSGGSNSGTPGGGDGGGETDPPLDPQLGTAEYLKTMAGSWNMFVENVITKYDTTPNQSWAGINIPDGSIFLDNTTGIYYAVIQNPWVNAKEIKEIKLNNQSEPTLKTMADANGNDYLAILNINSIPQYSTYPGNENVPQKGTIAYISEEKKYYVSRATDWVPLLETTSSFISSIK